MTIFAVFVKRPLFGMGQNHGLPQTLEAQQRYFSYRAILAAIVSQSSILCLFLWGIRTIIARYVAKWGIAEMCLCESKYQGGVSHHFGGAPTSLKKYRRDMGYRSDSIAVSRDMGPLSHKHGLCHPDNCSEVRLFFWVWGWGRGSLLEKVQGATRLGQQD